MKAEQFLISDRRGLFIDQHKKEIVVAYHKYSICENRSIDPVQLFDDPPLQSLITSSYVASLDFNLIEKSHLCFCDNPPDDLILNISRLNNSEVNHQNSPF